MDNHEKFNLLDEQQEKKFNRFVVVTNIVVFLLVANAFCMITAFLCSNVITNFLGM